MATFNSIVDVQLAVGPASVTTHTAGTKISEGPTYTPPAPTIASITVYVEKLANTKLVGTSK